jgi:hypothetical protein
MNSDMLSTIEFSYYIENMQKEVISVSNLIIKQGFNCNKEFNDFTIQSVLNDPIYKRLYKAKPEKKECKEKNCKCPAIRLDLCKKHLCLDKKNKCKLPVCNNLKFKYKSRKCYRVDDFCYHHRRMNMKNLLDYVKENDK